MIMWTIAKFQAVRDDILEQFKNLEKQEVKADGWPRRKINLCLNYVSLHKNDTSLAMHCIVHILIALSEHLHHGGLKDTQIHDLIKLAKTILMLARIKECTSKLSYLYGELHLITSQLEMIKGRPLHAAWEQQLAMHLSGSHIPGGLYYHHLMSGIQAMSSAQLEVAEGHLVKTLNQCPDLLLRKKAFIQLLRCYRLSGELEKAEGISPSTYKIPVAEPFDLELRWEKECRHVKKDGSIMKLQALVRKKKPHHRPRYILEAYLWSCAAPQRDLIKRLPKTRTLKNRSDLDFRSSENKELMKCVIEIERLYDLMIPLHNRLENAKSLLNLVEQVSSIERTLLITACLWRWLLRSNYHQLAEVLKGEYISKSIKLSSGRNNDALGIFGS